MQTLKKIAQTLKNEISQRYVDENLTIEKISNIYKLSAHMISKILKEKDVKINQYRAKYTVNHDFFNLQDSPIKSYWLGWLYADGYNQQEKGAIKLTVQEDDVDILNKFKKDLQSNNVLYFKQSKNPKHKNAYTLVINSKIMSNRLNELGCMQKKSLVLKHPTTEQVPNIFYRDWLRGMWEGDGCFSEYNTKKGRYEATCIFAGTNNVCVGIAKHLEDTIGVHAKIYYDKKSNNNVTMRLQISGNQQTYKLIKYLYQDCGVYLNRKYEKCLSIERNLFDRGLIKEMSIYESNKFTQ